MSVVKVIEVMAESEKSWEDAAKVGIEKASKSIENIASAWVKDHAVKVKNGQISLYRVTLKLTFEVK